MFYSERIIYNLSRVEQKNIFSTISNTPSFICLMSKDDGFFNELKNEIHGLTVLKETNKYILYRK